MISEWLVILEINTGFVHFTSRELKYDEHKLEGFEAYNAYSFGPVPERVESLVRFRLAPRDGQLYKFPFKGAIKLGDIKIENVRYV